MTLTGQLGTSNSALGNIELGAAPAAAPAFFGGLRRILVVVPWFPLPFTW